MNRQQLVALALEGDRDPSRSSRIAAWIADELRRQAAAGETAVPDGYLYQGSFEWVITAQNVAVESLSTVPLTSSLNPFLPLRVPFDGLVIGVQGWAEPASTPGEAALNQQFVAANLASAEDSRDLFSVVLGLDGQVQFGTDGNEPLMFPASVVLGTRTHPRPMAWTLRRNQLLQAKVRNITNVPLDGVDPAVMSPVILKTINIGFTVLNLGSP
jgi:hypothetical protein